MQTFPRLAAAFALCLVLPLAAGAGPDATDAEYTDGLQALAAHDYGLARTDFDAACLHGLGLACYTLALLMEQGQGGPKDPAGAAPLYRQACDATEGTATAVAGCYNYALDLYNGVGGETDIETAAEYWAKSCELGQPDGCRRAGGLMASGQAGRADFPTAYRYLETACDEDYGDSCYEAGLMIARGDIAPPDGKTRADFNARACTLGVDKACD